MAKAFFMVRAVVAAPLRRKFDQWYSADHLPRAMQDFKAEKGWRFWSTIEPGVHYAVYQFADRAKLEAAVKDDVLQPLIADFDKNFPTVARTRDFLTMAEERSGP